MQVRNKVLNIAIAVIGLGAMANGALAQDGEAAEEYLDNKGDRIEERLDNRGSDQ